VQDIVPATGLTIYKPSPLWPPPPEDVNLQVHELLRRSGSARRGPVVVPASGSDDDDGNHRDTVLRVTGEDGATMEIPHQIQLYTTNDLLIHPLVSPAFSYLGGLPPLLVVASDREVLRDEIVYTSVIAMQTSNLILMGCVIRAHRAANPEKYPVTDAVKKLYPTFEGIESRMKPTMVHFQIYDGMH
jgi:acetyl esterase/lipase